MQPFGNWHRSLSANPATAWKEMLAALHISCDASATASAGSLQIHSASKKANPQKTAPLDLANLLKDDFLLRHTCKFDLHYNARLFIKET